MIHFVFSGIEFALPLVESDPNRKQKNPETSLLGDKETENTSEGEE